MEPATVLIVDDEPRVLDSLEAVLAADFRVLRAGGGPWLALPEWTKRARPIAGVASVIGGLMFYVVAADWLGFHFTGLLLLTLWTRVLGAGWRMSLAVSVVATVAIHLSFYKLLRIPLPWGLLERFAF